MTESSYYLFEKESCDQLGLKLISTRLFARKAASHEELRDLISIFRDIERPLVIHCKSGADRAGLASAIWLMVMENRPVEDAQKMLSVKYVHLKFIKTGVLDYFLESYRVRNAQEPISFEDWVEAEYDPQKIQHGFDNRIPIA